MTVITKPVKAVGQKIRKEGPRYQSTQASSVVRIRPDKVIQFSSQLDIKIDHFHPKKTRASIIFKSTTGSKNSRQKEKKQSSPVLIVGETRNDEETYLPRLSYAEIERKSVQPIPSQRLENQEASQSSMQNTNTNEYAVIENAQISYNNDYIEGFSLNSNHFNNNQKKQEIIERGEKSLGSRNVQSRTEQKLDLNSKSYDENYVETHASQQTALDKALKKKRQRSRKNKQSMSR